MTEDQSIRWQKRTTSDIIEAVFTLYQMVIKSCWVWTATTELKQVVHTHRTSYPSSWSRGFGGLNPSPQYWIFTSVSVDFIPRFCLFTSAMVRIDVNFAPNCGTEPIRYVTLHLGDRRVAASLRYRYRTKITVLMCEQNPYPVWFRAGARALRD